MKWEGNFEKKKAFRDTIEEYFLLLWMKCISHLHRFLSFRDTSIPSSLVSSFFLSLSLWNQGMFLHSYYISLVFMSGNKTALGLAIKSFNIKLINLPLEEDQRRQFLSVKKESLSLPQVSFYSASLFFSFTHSFCVPLSLEGKRSRKKQRESFLFKILQ